MKPRKLYYRHVRKALPPGGKRRKEYLQTLKARMEECLPQDASYEEYCQALGKPEELADAYLADIGCAEINRRMRQSRLALVLVCMGVWSARASLFEVYDAAAEKSAQLDEAHAAAR